MPQKPRHLKTAIQLWVMDNRKAESETSADLARLTGVTVDTARGWESRGAGLWTLVSRAWPRLRVPIACLVFIVVVLSPPFGDGFIASNFTIGVAGLVAWTASGVDWRFAGLAGALAGIVKVFPAATAAATPHDKQRSLLLGIGAAALLVVVTLPLVGLSAWTDFGRALAGATPDCSPFNWSIACALAPFVGLGPGAAVGLAVGGAAGLAMLVVRNRLLLAALLTLAVMAPASNLHLQYWTCVVVLAIAIPAELSIRRQAVASATAISRRSAFDTAV